MAPQKASEAKVKRAHRKRKVLGENTELMQTAAGNQLKHSKKDSGRTEVEPDCDSFPQNDLFSNILKAQQTKKVNAKVVGASYVHRGAQQTIGLVPSCHLHSMGMMGFTKLKQKAAGPVTSLIKDLQLFRTSSPFDRRCTVLEWHPSKPHMLATGSKGGDIVLWDIRNPEPNMDSFIQGIGAGGTITSLKFHPTSPTKLYTTCFHGKVSQHDLEGRHTEVFVDTMNLQHWYASMDTNCRRNHIVIGDTHGNIKMLTLDGKSLSTYKVHKQKVSHAEYSPREDWLLVTGSVDRTVKIWDIRMIKDRSSCLESLEHEKPINSAYFSLTDGCRLLTTDQGQEIRVYNAATWRQETKILHPHRFFQHITPFKAHWHPLTDLIVVGRYPDPNFPKYTKDEKRTIDVFDAESGEIVTQLHDSNTPGVISLNKFNPQGDTLASTMGVNILLWKRKDELEENQLCMVQNMKSSEQTSGQEHKRKKRKPAENNKLKKMTENKLKLKK